MGVSAAVGAWAACLASQPVASGRNNLARDRPRRLGHLFPSCSICPMRIDRLSRLALRVLEDAVARAECGDVERTWGHRLALEYLTKVGIAEAWQAEAFWKGLAWQYDRHEYESSASYSQVTHLTGAITNWGYRLGIKPLDPVEMLKLSRPYVPDLDFGSGTQQLPCMCNRYTPGEREMIRMIFDARPLRAFNDGPGIIHPKDPGWVVRLEEGERVIDQMSWGFPVYVRGKAGQPLAVKPTNNARFDKLEAYWKRWAELPAHRCLIPAAAYAEAEGPKGSMTTTWLSVRDVGTFAWAGLWRASDEWGPVYTGVMTDNAPELLAVHDRAPVILRPDEWDTWLTAPLKELAQFDRPWPAAETRVKRTSVLWKEGGAVDSYGVGAIFPKTVLTGFSHE